MKPLVESIQAARLSRKTSRFVARRRDYSSRTANRHRWTRREAL